MRKIGLVAVLAFVVAAAACTAQASTIAAWDFNSNSSSAGTTNPSVGSGVLSLVGNPTMAWNTENDPTKIDPNDLTGYSYLLSLEIANWPAQTGTNKTNGIQFAVSTVGHSNIKVKFDIRKSIKNGETAPNTTTFQYTTDGTTWIDGPTWVDAGDQWYLNRTVDLSYDPAVNNNPNFAFRLMGAWQPGQGKYMPCTGAVYGPTRKWRVDLIKVYDDPPAVPANTVALWDFDDKRDGKADFGDGAAQVQLIGGTLLDGDGFSKDYSSGADQDTDASSSSDPSLKGKGLDTVNYPSQGTANDTAGLQFNLSTLGFSGIKIGFDVKHKENSSRCLRVQYTLDRTASTPVWVSADPLFTHQYSNFSQEAWWFNGNQADLTAVTGANNNPNFAFRIVTEFDPSTPGQYSASRSDGTYNADDPVFPGQGENKLRWDMVWVTATSAAPSSTAAGIIDAKKMPEWRRVTISNAIITAAHPDYFWVQTDDRTCSLKVYAPQHNLGDAWRATFSGITRNGGDTEKYIYYIPGTVTGVDTSSSVSLKPFYMVEKNLGGTGWFYNALTGEGQAPAPSPGNVGLSNIGQLVKISGFVTYMVPELDTPGNFDDVYVDDGSGVVDGNTYGPGGASVKGVRVALPKNAAVDYTGQYVSVTGISSVDLLDALSGTVVRCIRRPTIETMPAQ